jgi:hypothetical protein
MVFKKKQTVGINMMKIRILKYGILFVMASSCVRQGREAPIHEKIYRIHEIKSEKDTVYGEFSIQQLDSNTYLNSYWFHAAKNGRANNTWMMPDTTILHYFIALDVWKILGNSVWAGSEINYESQKVYHLNDKTFEVYSFLIKHDADNAYTRIIWTKEFGIISYLGLHDVVYSMVHFENPEKEKIVDRLTRNLLQDTAFFFYGNRLPPDIKYPPVY